MKGSQLRAVAWEAVKGRRGGILLAFALCGLPTLAAVILRRAGVPDTFLFPLSLAGGVFQFGFYRYVLRQVEDGSGERKDLCFAWGRAFLVTALVAVCLAGLCRMLLNLGPGWVQEQGYALSRRAMVGVEEYSSLLGRPYMQVADRALYDRGMILCMAGALLEMALGMAANLLFLPLTASLAVGKTGRAGAVVVDSIKLGVRYFGRSLAYLFWVELPLYGGMAVVVVMGLTGTPATPLFALAYAAFALWYLPYEVAAEVLYARELFFPGKWGSAGGAVSPPPVRRLRLKSGGGGWYWCGIGSGPKGGGYLERKGLRL